MSRHLILCLPFAGGTKEFYNVIRPDLEPDLEMVSYDYPGHGDRRKEDFAHSIEELATDIYRRFVMDHGEQINSGEADYAIMGYSMGSILALEITRQIHMEAYIREPKHVFISAHEPMTKILFDDIPEDQIDDYVKRRTIEFGGVPEKLIDNRSFWRMYLPVYRADYLMIANYRFEDVDFESVIPATVFYSEEDTKYSEMAHWGDFYTNQCVFVEYTGKHFFINQYHEDMARVIKTEMGCVE